MSCESESATKYTLSSSMRGTTHTCDTQPGTLFSSTRASSGKSFSFAAKNSSCLYRDIGSGTIWNAPMIFLSSAGSASTSAAATAGLRKPAARTEARRDRRRAREGAAVREDTACAVRPDISGAFECVG